MARMRTVFALVVSLLASCTPSAPASAPTAGYAGAAPAGERAATPPTANGVDEVQARQILTDVYAALKPDAPDGPDLLARGVLAKPLADAWRKARTPNADGEVLLDWMPEVEGQDYGVTDLVLTTARQGDTLVVTARFTNLGTPTTLVYDFVDEGGAPRIADIHGGVSARPSLRAFLETAQAQSAAGPREPTTSSDRPPPNGPPR